MARRRVVVLSTHDLDLALPFAGRLCLLSLDGSSWDGWPEALVLNRSIASIFESDRLSFDAYRSPLSSLSAPMCTLVTLVPKGRQ